VLATLLLLVLRAGLPRSLAFAGWQLGEGLQFPFALGLDAFAWPLALAAAALLLSALLSGVRRAPRAGWLTWLPGLALGAAGLLAIGSADLLAFAFTLFLFDVLAFMLSISPAAELRELVRRFALSLLSIGLVLLAWAAPASYAAFAGLMLLLALVLRLGVAVRWWKVAQPAELNAPLRVMALASALALLAQAQPFSGGLLAFILLVLLLVALWAAARGYAAPVAESWPYLTGAAAALALAAALCGALAAGLGFGLLALFAPALPALLGAFPRGRLPLLAAFAFTLSGLPFSPLNGVNALIAAAASPLAYALVLPYAVVLAGVWRALGAERTSIPPDERWTRGIETIGIALPALVFALLGFGLAPQLAETRWPFWLGLAGLAIAGGLWALAARRLRVLPPHVKLPPITSGGLIRLGRSLWAALQAALRFVSSLLEGEAGLLWALLLIALLISIVAQSGFAG
jgi:hypothetical protein